MAKLARADGPGAAVAAQQGGKVIHAAGYGLANIEWNVPIGADTVFRIASITKQFTAAAIMRLVDQGRLAVDDPIERLLPDYPVNGRPITVRHLLDHTSGIKSYTSLPHFAGELMRKDMSLGELIGVFKDLEPDFAPGERFLYNNSGYVLLGAIIEACSGKDYARFMADELFAPLGMEATRYLLDEPIVARRASGYSEPPTGLRNAATMSMSLPHAAGALGSTVGDLLTWDRALRGGEVVSPESYAAMKTPGRLNDGSSTSYGFGLRTSTYRGRPAIGHSGGINGFSTNITHWPDADLTVVVLANSNGFPVQQAFHALARRALDLPDRVRQPVTAEAGDLAAAAGVYGFEQGPVAFTVADGGLVAAFPRPGSVFRPFGQGQFFLERDPEVVLRFEQMADGAYQGLGFEAYGDLAAGKRLNAPPKG
jgi:CubicO group peptidase (beta-lactamase class C family)